MIGDDAPPEPAVRLEAIRADELRVERERSQLAIDAGGLGIWDWDIRGNSVVWSDRVYTLHDVEPGTFGGTVEAFAALVHPDDRAMVERALQATLERDAGYEVEFRVPLRSGAERWLGTRARLIRDDRGRPLRMVGATYDITHRVQLLAAERAGRERLELLARAGELVSRSLDREDALRALTAVVVPQVADWCRVDLYDASGELRHVLSHHVDDELRQRGAAVAAGVMPGPEQQGSLAWVAARRQPFVAIVEPAQLAALPDPALAAFLVGARLRSVLSVPLVARDRTIGVLTVLREDERPRQLDGEDLPFFFALGNRVALALDNARLLAEAEQARREAEAASRAKDEFLAILGHELRNPLAPITSALALLDARREPAAKREREIIGRQVEHLSRLVDDLLDVSRIVRGRVEIARARLDLRAVVAGAVETAGPLFEQRALRVEVELGDAAAWVEGDATRLAQVLTNLLANAAKFSARGGRVEVRLEAGAVEHRVSVRDEGVGIEPALLPRLFGLFVQGPQTLERRRGGLGLGLAIVANLIDLHGGRVEAESEGLGKGARFGVVLPAAAGGLLEA